VSCQSLQVCSSMKIHKAFRKVEVSPKAPTCSASALMGYNMTYLLCTIMHYMLAQQCRTSPFRLLKLSLKS
jgi:hypothetical protein